MDVFKADVAIVGAGGAGLREAIAVAEGHPKLRIALISKVYPMRSHTALATVLRRREHMPAEAFDPDTPDEDADDDAPR